MASIETLQKRVNDLEKQLEAEKQRNKLAQAGRSKITQMSSEVVDSNPYR